MSDTWEHSAQLTTLRETLPRSSPRSLCAALTFIFTVIMLAFNTSLSKHAKKNPKGVLCRKNLKGILCCEIWSYFLNASIQGIVLPLLWIFNVCTQDADWYFNGKYGWFNLSFSAVLIAYYVEDCIFFGEQSGFLIIAHHAGTILLIVCAVVTSGWRGLNLTVGLIYELGSLCMSLVDLGLAPRSVGPVGMIATTVLGLVSLLHGVFTSPPPDYLCWTSSVVFVIGGLGRFQQSIGYLVSPAAPEAFTAPKSQTSHSD